MRGIDISHYNGWPFDAETSKAYPQSDFVIVKATQGTSYKYVDYFRKAVEKVLKDGKLAGAYHYAAGKDPDAEADYFLETVKPYLGRIALALDWEEGQNAAWGSSTWAKAFIDRIKQKTGLTCWLYTGMDALEDCASCAKVSPLWFAGYPTDRNSWTVPKWPGRYTTEPWDNYLVWQFTSGADKLDRDTTQMTAADWARYTRPQTQAEPAANGYRGDWPTIPARGYYRLGDGIWSYLDARNQIKRVQALAVWISGADLSIDGKYGPKTVAAVKEAQSILGETADGLFGRKTLQAAKAFRK